MASLLCILAVAAVLSMPILITAQNKYENYTTDEQMTCNTVDTVAADLTVAEKQIAGDIRCPPYHRPCFTKLPPKKCECHAHGDVRYVTCDGTVFYDNQFNVIGVMARSYPYNFWYVLLAYEYYKGTTKTRIRAMKFKCFLHFVIVHFKKTTNPLGTYRVKVGSIFAPIGTYLYDEDVVIQGPEQLLYSVGPLLKIEIKQKEFKGETNFYICIRCFGVIVYVRAHCVVVVIWHIWCGWFKGLCGPWNNNMLDDHNTLSPNIIPTDNVLAAGM